VALSGIRTLAGAPLHPAASPDLCARKQTTRPARRQGARWGGRRLSGWLWARTLASGRMGAVPRRSGSALRVWTAIPEMCPPAATGRQAGKGSHARKARLPRGCLAPRRWKPPCSHPGSAVAISCRGEKGERKAVRIRSAASGAFCIDDAGHDRPLSHAPRAGRVPWPAGREEGRKGRVYTWAIPVVVFLREGGGI
jgi:hypothetical protein